MSKNILNFTQFVNESTLPKRALADSSYRIIPKNIKPILYIVRMGEEDKYGSSIVLDAMPARDLNQLIADLDRGTYDKKTSYVTSAEPSMAILQRFDIHDMRK